MVRDVEILGERKCSLSRRALYLREKPGNIVSGKEKELAVSASLLQCVDGRLDLSLPAFQVFASS
jgi:hypothetical protein